jgi:hypothetical protein
VVYFVHLVFSFFIIFSGSVLLPVAAGTSPMAPDA